MRRNTLRKILAIALLAVHSPVAHGVNAVSHPARAFREKGQPVTPAPDGTIFCEAEEFRVEKPGWQAKPWGENYYAATLANTFLSRKAFLGAPENCEETVAAINVDVKEAGRYLVLVRYEAAYRFETQFRVRVEQGGKTVFNRLYGARDNVKIWAFGQKLRTEVAWPWGAVENIVWEGHDAFVDLHPGLAQIQLIAGKQPAPAARRNVDVVMLTRDVEQVKMRIEKEGYLPLDGWLTQQGDVWMKVHDTGHAKVTAKADKVQEHSPYWVHIRNWKPISVGVEPGKTTDWIDVGSLWDALNDGQWVVNTSGPCKLEFGVRTADGRIESLRTLDANGDLTLIAPADTRYSRTIRTQAEGVKDLLAGLNEVPKRGTLPTQTLLYASTSIPEFKSLYGLASMDINQPGALLDWRGLTATQLEEKCIKLTQAQRNNIAVMSLGDEIGLPAPDANAAKEGYATFLKAHGVDPGKYVYSADPTLKQSNPGDYYWSRRFLHHYGIQEIKKLTDVLRQHLPHAQIGANYSPHGGAAHSYLGEVFQWVTCFREDGMTMPWSEDYIWQVPVGSPQMNEINLDLFRAGLRGKPDRKILYYVMPHWPGNTPNMWRRQFYGDIAHGMKIVNLFEFEPVWIAYTENHVTHPEMYATVLRTFRELGSYEDIVQAGQVRPAEVGLWFSETADIWGDNEGSFAAAKRALYIAIRQQQIPLDMIVEQDALDGTLNQYRALYLTDQHVSLAASKKLAEWVNHGGRLFATAGAGMFDEYNQPNQILRELFAVKQTALDQPADSKVGFIKQDLPFAKAITDVRWGAREFPAFGAVSRIQDAGGTVLATFSDGLPAVVSKKTGAGETTWCAFLPGLSYFKTAIPLRPVDRGSTDEAMSHLLPTGFDAGAGELIRTTAANVPQPVVADHAGVETTVIESKRGTLISVVNWSGAPIHGLRLEVRIPVPSHVSLASGANVQSKRQGNTRSFTLDLDVADALILR